MVPNASLVATSSHPGVGCPAAHVTIAPASSKVLGRQWRRTLCRQARMASKRVLAAHAEEGTSLHLVSSEEHDDGTILFCFGEEPAKEKEAVAAQPDVEQQTKVSIPEQQAVTTAQQDEEEPAQSVDKARELTPSEEPQENQLSSDGTQQTISSQIQQTASPQSEQAQPDISMSSADTSDEEASASDSNSERLWDMTPQQLEGLKVAELKDLCKQGRVKGYSKLKKDQLIHLLQEQLQSR